MGVRLDIEVERSGTCRVVVQVLDSGGVNPRTDLNGWTGAFQVRSDRSPDAELLASGTVTIDAATGIVTGVLPTTETDPPIPWAAGEHDMYIEDPSQTPPERIWLTWGTARFKERVTA
jgi:hypothetical protein